VQGRRVSPWSGTAVPGPFAPRTSTGGAVPSRGTAEPFWPISRQAEASGSGRDAISRKLPGEHAEGCLRMDRIRIQAAGRAGPREQNAAVWPQGGTIS